jgi:tRNA (guanine-N7-)-methyltransferase
MQDTPTATPAIETEEHPRKRPFMRTVRSFVKRAGRTTIGQSKALDALGPRYLVAFRQEPLDIDSIFDPGTNGQALVLEIGFGMGEATAHIAAVLPHTRFLCCEVHEPGVGALLKRIGEQGLQNIRICAHDAVEVIDHMLRDASLDGVHIFFPDPWHKTKHTKRRLIQPSLVTKLVARMKPGGYIHCATDWQPYAQQMLAVLGAEPQLRNRAGPADTAGGYCTKPHYRPQTKFERRGLRLGHGVWDLVFERV